MNVKFNRDENKTKEEKILSWLFDKSNEVIAQEDGFYFCEYDENGDTVYRKHDDCITHWMPLPEPPKEEI